MRQGASRQAWWAAGGRRRCFANGLAGGEFTGVGRGSARFGLLVAIMLAAMLALAPAGAEAAPLTWSTPTTIDPTGGTPNLRAVQCPSASQCTAVDQTGLEVTFDPQSPGTPTPALIDPGGGVNALACPSATQCTEVDSRGNEVTFDPLSPGTPTSTTIDTSAKTGVCDGGQCGPTSVACPSATQCTALVSNRDEVTFDPQSPGSPTPTPIGGGQQDVGVGVACPSTTECVDVGFDNEIIAAYGYVITFDPQSPGTPTFTSTDKITLRDPECPSTTQCTAIDDSSSSNGITGKAVTFNPQSVGTLSDTSITVDTLACPSTTQCTGVSSDSLVTFDPQSPASATSTAFSGPSSALACPSSAQCTAVGDGAEVTFDPQSPGTPSATTIENVGGALSGLACPSTRQCTAVDNAGYEVTFDPQSSATPTHVLIDSSSGGPSGVACPSTTQCTAVDYYGNEVTFNPASPASPTPTDVLGHPKPFAAEVACPSVSQCTAVDHYGTEVTFDPQSPGTPSPTSVDSSGILDDVACPSMSQCTVVDDGGNELTFDPQSPATPTAVSVDQNTAILTGVACPSATQCTAVDNSGHEVTFDPRSPGNPTPTSIDTSGLSAVACPSMTECVAIDGEIGAVVGDPTGASAWTVEPISGMTALTGVACPSAGLCVAVDSTGDEAATLQSTVTSISADPTSATTNQPVVLTATVSAGSGVPAGTVAFMKGGVVIAGCGSEPVALSGSQYLATCPASFDAASSPESLTAVFSATANSGLAGSTSAVDLLSVAKAATTTSIAASSNSPAAGASVSYRATVTPAQSGSALPSGVVEFMDGEQAIGSCASASLSGSAAVCKITATAGTHMISAAYSGDANFSASRSPALSSAVGAPRPVSTAPPKVTGTPKPGKTLTCNTGQWTGAPRFSFAWNRDGVALYANVAHRRRVVQLDEGSTLSCTVTATNGGGSSSVTSPTVRVAVPFVKGCPAATGLLSDTTLGLIHLGMTRRQARHAYRRHSNRGRQYEDFFCLTPIGVRVGYGSPKLTRALKRATRARYADHVVWASTSNPRYALDKVRVGESAATAAKLLGTGPPLHIGLNYWYLAVKHKLTLVLKVRDEAVQEVGIATNALTRTRAEQRTLMHSFY